MNIEPRDPRQNPRMAKEVERVRALWESETYTSAGRPRIDGRPKKKAKILKRRKVLLSFDDMLDALLVPCINYSDIATACDCSRERIRQIHRDYFATLIPYRPRGRQKMCTIVTRAQIRRDLTPRGVAASFAEAATKHGLQIDAIEVESGGKIAGHTKLLRVNGYLVACHATKSPMVTGKRRKVKYFVFHVSWTPCDFNAFWCGDPLRQWFVVPSKALKADRFYVPDHMSTYHTANSDAWQYRDAWHLLEAE